jgi:hypothetical protein
MERYDPIVFGVGVAGRRDEAHAARLGRRFILMDLLI